MSKEMAVIAFGIWVLVIPYLGIPGEWRTIVTVITGALLVGLGFFLRAEMLSRGVRRSTNNHFVENRPGVSEHAHDHQERITSLN